MLISNFEATLDDLVGDGKGSISEFVDWESSGPTYTFNELRNAFICFNTDHIYLFGLAYTGRELKKTWTTMTIELNGIEFQKHPENIKFLLEFSIKVEAFIFRSL